MLRVNWVLHADDLGTSRLHQLHASTHQIAHRTRLARIDIALMQDPQTQQVRKPARVVLIGAVLESLVLHHRRWLRQVHAIARRHQPIHQPVPVVGRLHHDALKRLLVGATAAEYPPQLIPQSLLKEHTVFLSMTTITLLFAWRSIPAYSFISVSSSRVVSLGSSGNDPFTLLPG